LVSPAFSRPEVPYVGSAESGKGLVFQSSRGCRLSQSTAALFQRFLYQSHLDTFDSLIESDTGPHVCRPCQFLDQDNRYIRRGLLLDELLRDVAGPLKAGYGVGRSAQARQRQSLA